MLELDGVYRVGTREQLQVYTVRINFEHAYSCK